MNLSHVPMQWRQSWPLIEAIVKLEALLLFALFAFVYSPNFMFFLKPLPVLHGAGPAQIKQIGTPLNETSLLELINTERIEFGVNTLTTNEILTQAAHARAEDMIINKYFAHTSPKGVYFTETILNSGYNYEFAGENLAKDFTTSESVMRAWKDSQSHYKNIINSNYSETGIAIVQNPFDGSHVIVQLFGSPSQN